jgi:hypothetical protein
MKKLFCFLFIITASTIFAWGLKTGTYDLVGANPDGSTYHGQVVIAPQGDNYSVVWYMDNGQTQVGVGVHRYWDSVLSVAFADLSKNFWGVASYKVDVWGDIEGAWCSSTANVQGADKLRWVSSAIY